jgi:hypothetical protein
MRPTILSLASLGLVASGLAPCSGEDKNRELALSVALSKPAYRAGEPLLLKVRFEGDPAAKIALTNRASGSEHFYLISDPAKGERWDSPFCLAVRDFQFRRMPQKATVDDEDDLAWLCRAGAALERQLVVCQYGRGIELNLQPGSYRMRVAYSMRRRPIEDLLRQKMGGRVPILDGAGPDLTGGYEPPLLSEPFTIRVVENDNAEGAAPSEPTPRAKVAGSEAVTAEGRTWDLLFRTNKTVYHLDEPLLLIAGFAVQTRPPGHPVGPPTSTPPRYPGFLVSDYGAGSEFFYAVVESVAGPKDVRCLPMWKLQFIKAESNPPPDRRMTWLRKAVWEPSCQLVIYPDGPDLKLPAKPGEYRLRIGYSLHADRLRALILERTRHRVTVEPAGPARDGAYDKPLLSEPLTIRFIADKPAEKPKPGRP